MFGQNALLGDFLRMMSLPLSKIVLNVPDAPKPRRISLQERLARYDFIQVQQLSEFIPQGDELYVIGFFGRKMDSLVNELKTKFGFKFETLIHISAILSNADFGEGCVLNAGCVFGSYVKLGRHCFVNRGATIGHDTELGDYAIVSPGANVASNVRIEAGAYIGMGANVLEDLIIGENSIVAAGAVVTEDVPPNVMVAGVPAVVKKRFA